jgi:HPt (histidine-containing phosphotransfer) domain-containing protein
MAIDPRPYPLQSRQGESSDSGADDGGTGRRAADSPKDVHDGAAQVFDRNELIRRCGGDVGIAAHIAARFQLRSERDLQEIEAAVDCAKQDAVVATAHRLKGVAASLSAHRLAECYRTLEMAAREGDLAGAPELLETIKAETARVNRALSTEMALSPVR